MNTEIDNLIREFSRQSVSLFVDAIKYKEKEKPKAKSEEVSE